MKKIFIIEDNKTLRTELINLLKGYGYECDCSDNFQNIIQISLAAKCNLILLDINLPYNDGYHICREIRKQSDIPIIVVTSRSSDMDELMSMNLGADDFVSKPYNTQILFARISALLKRTESKESIDTIEFNGLVLIPAKSLIEYNGKNLELTKNELKIINILMKNAGCIVSRDEIMNELWQSDEFVDDNTLTVNINRLRKKLDELGATNYIKTKRGQGYLI